MADQKITQLTNYTTPQSSDVLPIVDVGNSITKKVTIANLFNILSSLFRIKDSSDTSKQIAFDASGITTGTVRTLTVPDASDTLVLLGATQTLTSKTLGATTKINTSGSDGTGAMYYRDSGGNLVPFTGTNTQIVAFNSSNLPVAIPNPAAADATYSVKGVRVLDANAVYYGAASGATNTYAITLSPAPSAYAVGQVFVFKANAANTGAATLNVNAIGAISIVKYVSTALVSGDIAINQFVQVVYDGTNFVLQVPIANLGGLGLYKNGTTTKDATDASTAQTIAHGLGVIPKKVRIKAYPSGTNQTDNVLPFMLHSESVYNGTTQSSLSLYQNGTSAQVTGDTTFRLNIATTSGGDYQTGVITFDSTNITITWTKTGTATGTYNLLWEAEA